MKQVITTTKDTEETDARTLGFVNVLFGFCLLCDLDLVGWVLHCVRQGWRAGGQAGKRAVSAGGGRPSGGALDLGPEMSCEHLGA